MYSDLGSISSADVPPPSRPPPTVSSTKSRWQSSSSSLSVEPSQSNGDLYPQSNETKSRPPSSIPEEQSGSAFSKLPDWRVKTLPTDSTDGEVYADLGSEASDKFDTDTDSLQSMSSTSSQERPIFTPVRRRNTEGAGGQSRPGMQPLPPRPPKSAGLSSCASLPSQPSPPVPSYPRGVKKTGKPAPLPKSMTMATVSKP